MTEWKRDTPWRQGHLLTSAAAEALNLRHSSHPEATLVIVATHDCDLTQSPAIEPMVEVLVGRRIEKMDGNHTHAKSSRTLHIEFEGNPSLLAEFVVTHKHNISKDALKRFSPDTRFILAPVSRHTFQRWMAARYRRGAFPDEFEQRMKASGLAERIKRAVKPHGDLITGLFFDVDEGRESEKSGPDDVYLLDIVILYAGEPDFEAADAAANALVGTIRQAFEEKLLDKDSGIWKLIELRFIDSISENALTYQIYKNLTQWRLDHISLGAEPQQPMVAE